MNKKVILCIVLGLIILSLTVFLLLFRFYSNNLDEYFKYTSTIIISSKSLTKPILITVNSDGSNYEVSSNYVNNDALIVDNSLYYLEDNVYSKFKLNKSYKDIYNTLVKLKITKKVSDTEYDIHLSNKELNLLLEALLFNKKSTSDANGKIEILDNKISSFSTEVNGINGYETLKIDIMFKPLNENYIINIDNIFNQNQIIPGNRKKIEETRKNVFEIIN